MLFSGVKSHVDGDCVTLNGVQYELDVNAPTDRLNSDNYLFLNLRGGYITVVKEGKFKQNIKLEIEEL